MKQSNQDIHVLISLGELVDKISILEIKTKHLDGIALENVTTELKALRATLRSLQLDIDISLIQDLRRVNEELWHIEDAIRDKERQGVFDQAFVELARSVYLKNDQRAATKKEINTKYGSTLIEEKSYQKY